LTILDRGVFVLLRCYLMTRKRGKFMKKRLLIIVMAIVSFICIYAFVKKDINNRGEEKIDMLKVNLPYFIRQNFSVGLWPIGVENKYGKADITRILENRMYEIRNMDDDSKLFVIYNRETNTVIDMWQLKKLLSRDDFQNIVAGESTSNDILKLDPYSTILEKSETGAMSEHRLKDNQSVLIEYSKENDEWIVEELKFSDSDSTVFPRILTPEDMKLISWRRGKENGAAYTNL